MMMAGLANFRTQTILFKNLADPLANYFSHISSYTEAFVYNYNAIYSDFGQKFYNAL